MSERASNGAGRGVLGAAVLLGLLEAAIAWRLWTPIDGARRVLAVQVVPAPLYGAVWPILHAWLLALGVWVWTRDRSPAGAPVAAAIAGFALWAEPPSAMALGVAWLPWFLWAAERFSAARAAAWGATAAALLALAVAGGLPDRATPLRLASLPLLCLGPLPLLAASAAISRRGLLLAAGTLGALALGRPSIAVLLGAALAAEGIERLPRAAGRVVATGAGLAVAAAATAAVLSHLPNRAEAPRDLAALLFAETVVATWALHQIARDGRRLFVHVAAVIAAFTLWFDGHARFERNYRPGTSAIADTDPTSRTDPAPSPRPSSPRP